MGERAASRPVECSRKKEVVERIATTACLSSTFHHERETKGNGVLRAGHK